MEKIKTTLKEVKDAAESLAAQYNDKASIALLKSSSGKRIMVGYLEGDDIYMVKDMASGNGFIEVNKNILYKNLSSDSFSFTAEVNRKIPPDFSKFLQECNVDDGQLGILKRRAEKKKSIKLN